MVAMWRFPAEVQRKKMLKWKIWDFISWFIRNTTMAEKKYTGAPFGTQTARYTIRLISFLGQLGGVFMTPINRFRIINKYNKCLIISVMPRNLQCLDHWLLLLLYHYMYHFRFDVSGVHPKSKYPGTFTEIPYDKKSIDELVNTLTDYTS